MFGNYSMYDMGIKIANALEAFANKCYAERQAYETATVLMRKYIKIAERAEPAIERMLKENS